MMTMAMSRKATQLLDYVKIPGWVNDLESFRVWSDSRHFPEVGRISYYEGTVHVDMSKEQLYTHGMVKTAIAHVLFGLAEADEFGHYWCDGAYVTHVEADLSNVPDGVFVATTTLESGRVREVEGKMTGFVELEGSPDMVLEIVSDKSVRKDTDSLRYLYWVAGISEYWLVDARGDEPLFNILRRTAKEYVSVRPTGGWL